MGVPGLYRWAVRKIPQLKQTSSNPPYEFDNVYLDFNGAVHGCVDEWSLQESLEVLFGIIEAHLATLLSIVRPRALLFIAIDGVAPRAKMNQQRSRRFRAAKQAEEEQDAIERLLQKFDRNAITPGTDFMRWLGARLRTWAAEQAEGPLREVTIVISDHLDPGEGEHKIMEVIRHHPERSHCLHSNDGDLVFLGLVSPADRVYLLRAKKNARVDPAVLRELEKLKAEEAAAKAASEAAAAEAAPEGDEAAGEEPGDTEAADAAEGEEDGQDAAASPSAASMAAFFQDERRAAGGKTAAQVAGQDYELLSIVALRTWLSRQLPDCDPQRLAMDFVAMCCLSGNDFLPHIPVVDIYEGGIDLLMRAYHKVEPGERGYLVDEELRLVLPRWREFLQGFMRYEAECLLDEQHLGLGMAQPPQRGPGPPTDAWDGLSVLLRHAPAGASAKDVRAALAKQGCVVESTYKVVPPRPKSPVSWVVRMADPYSAVMTLVATRKIYGQKVLLDWVHPAAHELVDVPEDAVFEPADWRPAMERAVLETFHYWLGPSNLPNDAFVRRNIRAREDRFVPIKVFAKFKRLKTWVQDLGWIAQILRASPELEVTGEGEEAMVRGKADHSARPDETAEQVERQQRAVSSVVSGDCAEAVLALKRDFYARRAGPSVAGAPLLEDVEAMEKQRSLAFLQGIEWVVQYYNRGCPCWSWFYPAHYPPLCASIWCHLQPLPPLAPDAPFLPMLQLLAVLPPQSAALLPSALQRLLKAGSPLEDFYPEAFELDMMDGERDWQAIVLLPFVDETRLRSAVAELGYLDDADATPAEAFRAGRLPLPPAAFALRPSVGSWLSSRTTQAALRSWDFRASDELPEGRPLVRTLHEAPPIAPRDGKGGRGKGKGKGKGKKGGGRGGSRPRGSSQGEQAEGAPAAEQAPAGEGS